MLQRGREALARGEWEEARLSFESAIEHDPASAEAHEGLGWALFWGDRVEASFERREAAYRLYVSRGDVRAAARVAMGIAIDASDVHGFAVTTGWMERARRLLAGAPESEEHGWLCLWDGHLARAVDHDLELAAARATEARTIACRLGIPDLELLSSALEGLVMVTRGEVREGMRQLDESTAAAVAGEIRDLDSIAAACCFLVHACERVRDYERAAQWGERIAALASRWRIESVFALCQAEHAAMLIGRGEWEAAEAQLSETLRTIETRRPLIADSAVAHFGDLRRRQGRIDEALELFARVESNTLAMIGTAAIALDRGDALRCADLMERLRRRPMAEKWVERVLALDLFVRAHLTIGSRPEDETVSAAMADLRTIARRVGTEMIRAVAGTTEAACCSARGDWTAARAGLEDAVDLFERCGASWESARTRLELASALRHLGRDAFAREELAAARDAFRRLGCSGEAERAETLLAGSVPAHRGAAPPLTRRELDVIRMVARGMSDKEAAAGLGLSEHTVHRHVANILTKLSLSSRAAAAALATREGWI